MLNLTIQQLFGANATQDSQNLIIQKADLPPLTASADNRAEQLLVAILLQAQKTFEGVLNDEQERVINDEQERAVTYDNRELYEKINFSFWKHQFVNRIQLDIFVIDVFIKPPTAPQQPLIVDSLNYS